MLTLTVAQGVDVQSLFGIQSDPKRVQLKTTCTGKTNKQTNCVRSIFTNVGIVIVMTQISANNLIWLILSYQENYPWVPIQPHTLAKKSLTGIVLSFKKSFICVKRSFKESFIC